MQPTDAIVHSISKQNRNHKTYKKNLNEQTQKAKEKNKKQKNTPQESSQKQDLYILTHFNETIINKLFARKRETTRKINNSR